MELRHARYFVAVAEELNFRRAAERLHLAQPSLSTQIRLLEEDVGAKLLERDSHKVGLTPAGRSFLEGAEGCFRTRTIIQELRAGSTAEKAARSRLDLFHPSPTACFQAFFASSGNDSQTYNFS
jgi:DNA-binding transcriptional LysR family regulator